MFFVTGTEIATVCGLSSYSLCEHTQGKIHVLAGLLCTRHHLCSNGPTLGIIRVELKSFCSEDANVFISVVLHSCQNVVDKTIRPLNLSHFCSRLPSGLATV